MKILVLQETDWLIRGPHTQHHIFERLSKNPKIKITVIDYDIEKLQKSKSLFIKRQEFCNINRVIKNSNVKIIRTANVQVPYIRRISSLITNFFEILEIVRKNRPDIIIGFSMSNGLIGLFFAKLLNIPYIFYCLDLLHTLVPFIFIQDIARLANRISLKYADQVIVVTEMLQNYVINEGALPTRVKILRNGVSLENETYNEQKHLALKSKYTILDKDFVIFFMGYLYDFAGLKEIIDYYNADIKQGKIFLKFMIVGDGGIYNALIRHINEIEANWVILTGRVPFFDIVDYIQLADLCLLSFKLNNITKDITPIKILEYMAMKKAVLSTSLPNVVLELGQDSGVIFVKNQKDLIKKIGALSSQKAFLKNIGKKGYTFVKKKYLWSGIVKEFNIIMLDLLIKKKYKKR